jgi:glycosyltransferase involved in cell wall biosynthesis
VRILYFSSDYTTHDRRFLAKMCESPHAIEFLRLHDDGIACLTPPLPRGVHAVRWKGIEGKLTPDACFRAMPRFSQALDQAKPDLVHAGPIPTCAFMAALAGVRPLMAMSWGSDILVEGQDDELVRWTTDYALSHADVFVVDCDAVRERIRAITGAASERFVQFPWGLDLSRFPPPVSPARHGKEITILSTRSWAPIYDIETVLEAFRLAHAAEARLRLVLVGDGPLATLVDAKIAEDGIGRLVERPGHLSEEALAVHFASADAYLSCALSDGTSVSLLEAMAHGLPIVATDAPGNREWVTPDRGGWLAPAGDAAAFASALLRAAHLGDERRNAIAQWNRSIVEDRADWDKNTRRLLAAYDRLAASR